MCASVDVTKWSRLEDFCGHMEPSRKSWLLLYSHIKKVLKSSVIVLKTFTPSQSIFCCKPSPSNIKKTTSENSLKERKTRISDEKLQDKDLFSQPGVKFVPREVVQPTQNTMTLQLSALSFIYYSGGVGHCHELQPNNGKLELGEALQSSHKNPKQKT